VTLLDQASVGGLPAAFHEPYYQNYLSDDFPAIARRCGLAHWRDTKAYVSKVMVFDKKAGVFEAISQCAKKIG
jgi:hypothetical protein